MKREPLKVVDGRPWSVRRWARWLNASLAGASVMVASGCVMDARFQAESDQTITAPASVAALRIDNGVGDVEVVGVEGATEVRAEVLKRGRGRTQEEADEALAEIVVTLAPDPQSPGTLLGTVDYPKRHGSSWTNRAKQYEVQWRITAPPAMALDVKTDVGELTVRGFHSGARLKADVGDIRAEEILGGLNVQTDVGDIVASASGAIDARADVGDISVTALPGQSGAVTIAGDVGDITLSLPDSWEGEVFASTDVGNLHRGLDSFRGEGRQSRHTLRGVVGAGSPGRVHVSTDVGDVRVRHSGVPVRDHGPSPDDAIEGRRGQPL